MKGLIVLFVVVIVDFVLWFIDVNGLISLLIIGDEEGVVINGI